MSDLPGPRIYILHNVVTKEEAAHLKSLGIIKGMEKALIIPYGGKDLIESTTRTNTGAWLDFAQDEVVRKVERVFADFTGTDPENGENLQVNPSLLVHTCSALTGDRCRFCTTKLHSSLRSITIISTPRKIRRKTLSPAVRSSLCSPCRLSHVNHAERHALKLNCNRRFIFTLHRPCQREQ